MPGTKEQSKASDEVKPSVPPKTSSSSEEEWPDDIVESAAAGHGDDDMYGDMLESGWIGGLWGVGLLKEAESRLASIFLLRSHVEQDCIWTSVLADFLNDDNSDADEEEDGAEKPTKTMKVSELRDLWTKQNDGNPPHGPAIAAACLRFGPAYSQLRQQLKEVNESGVKTERSRKRRNVYKTFNMQNVLPTLTIETHIDVTEMIGYLRHTELMYEIVEIQISRASRLLEGKRSEFVTAEFLMQLASQLGMSGLSGKLTMPLCASALSYAGLHKEVPCPVEALERYCIDRAGRCVRADQRESKIRSLLMTLFKPKQFEREQLTKLLSKSGQGMTGIKIDEAQDRDGGARVAHSLKRQVRAKHVMVLLRSMPKTSGDGLVSQYALVSAMEKQYPHLPGSFIALLCNVWFRPEDVLVDPDVVRRFFFPAQGFTVRVRLPVGGGFRISGKLAPTDSTTKIYRATVKQMFAKLRQINSESRVPPDVKLFTDEHHTTLIPNKTSVCVCNEIDNGSRIFATSEYVTELLEQMDEEKQDVTTPGKGSSGKGMGAQGSNGTGSGSSKTPGAATTSSGTMKSIQKANLGEKGAKSDVVKGPTSSGSPRPIEEAPKKKRVDKSKAKPGTLQEALDKLMTVSEPIPVPPNPPFPGLLSEAHTWGIPLMTKYLRDEVELGMYEAVFLRAEMTGLRFIQLDEAAVISSIELEHSLHAKKIADHAAYLRGLVFERASIVRPAQPDEWACVHLAGWMAQKLDCHMCAFGVLRKCMDGDQLLHGCDASMLIETFRMGTPSDKEIAKALKGTKDFIESLCTVEPLSVRKKKGKDKNQLTDEELEAEVAREQREKEEAEATRLRQEQENFAKYRTILLSLDEALKSTFATFLAAEEEGRGKDDSDDSVKAIHNNKVGATMSVAVAPSINGGEVESKTSRLKEKRKQEQETPVEAAALPMPEPTSESKENTQPLSNNASTLNQDEDIKEKGDVQELGIGSKGKGTAKDIGGGMQKTNHKAQIEEVISAPKKLVPIVPANPVLDEKVSQLTVMMEEQSKNIARLEQTASALREEKVKTEEMTRESIAELRQNRKSAEELLDSMASKYLTDMDASKKAMERAINDLNAHKDALLERGKHGSVAPPNSAPAPAPVPELVDHSTTTATNYDVTASLPIPTIQAPKPQPAAPRDREILEEAKSATTIQGDPLVPEDVPLREFKSVGQMMGFDAHRPLQDASDLVLYGGKKPTKDKDADSQGGAITNPKGPASASRDFQALFMQSASAEVTLWKSIVSRYQHRNPSTLMVSETSAQMGRIATLWLRLGTRMLDDSRLPRDEKQPSSGGKRGVLSAAGLHEAELVDIEEEDEDGLTAELTEEMKTALCGMERCARALLSTQIPDILIPVKTEHRDDDLTGGVNAAVAKPESEVDPYEGHIRRKVKVTQTTSSANAAVAMKESLKRRESAEEKKRLQREVDAQAQVRQGTVVNSHRRYDYEVAAGMVFCLGLVKRLLQKYPNRSDFTHLLYLFNHLREGTLPLADLSRENIRSLIGTTLNITLPSWPQFDSLCQRFDPEGKGFCSIHHCVTALKHINPLGDGLGPGDYQGVVLLVLSVAEKQLGAMCKRLDSALLDVIFGAAAHVASFEALVGSKKKADGGSNDIGLDDLDEWDDWADGDEVSEEEQEKRSMRMADEVQLVTDLLLESSRSFLKEGSGGGDDHNVKVSKASLSSNSGTMALPHSFRRDQPSTSCALCFTPPTQHTLLPACNLAARGLQIYEGRKEPILTALETLMTIHLLFRLMVLRKLKKDEDARESEEAEAALNALKRDQSAKDLLPPPTRKEKSSMRLTVPQILDQVAYIEADATQLLGTDRASAVIKQTESDGVSLEEVERLLTELLGCPVPERGVLGLYSSQVEVECYIYHKHTAVVLKDRDDFVAGKAVGTGAVAVAEKHKVHYQMALSEISASLAEELGRGTSEEGQHDAKKSEKKGGHSAVRITSSGKPVIRSKDLENSHLIAEMSSLMHRQRVDQVAVMLDHLNSKASRRKRSLEAALSLLESLKVLMPGTKVVSGVVTARNLAVLSFDEIGKRTRDLMRMVEQDMTAQPTEAIKQLTKKVNNFKLALKTGTIRDEDGALTMILQELQSLEQHVAQASADCLDILGVIQEKAKK